MKYYYRFIFIFAFISPFQSNLLYEDWNQIEVKWEEVKNLEEAPHHTIMRIDDLLQNLDAISQNRNYYAHHIELDSIKNTVLQKRHQAQLSIFEQQLEKLNKYPMLKWDTYMNQAEKVDRAITAYRLAYPAFNKHTPLVNLHKASHLQVAQMRFDIVQYGVDKLENNEISDFGKCIEYTELIQKHARYFLATFPNDKQSYLANNYIKYAFNKGNQLFAEKKEFEVIASNVSMSLDSVDLDAHYAEISAYINEHPNSIKTSALEGRKEAIDFHKYKKAIQSLPKSIKQLNQQIALGKKYQSSFKNEDFIAELKEIQTQSEAKRGQVFKKELAHYTKLAKQKLSEKTNSFAQSKSKCTSHLPQISTTNDKVNKSDKNTYILNIQYLAKIKMGDQCKAINQFPILGTCIIKGNAYKGLKIDYTNVKNAGNIKEVALN